ncbi:hypothetical protein CDAR_241661 [Caerostris darwini]|uniref:Uncharacterized protein n=1 Tax=Caerostris darwini TaxID=1538125 RepID=A0AAV4U2B2_9ARAC|nr:hypothetical protein CDAR_241661 [Caerostris darwini]
MTTVRGQGKLPFQNPPCLLFPEARLAVSLSTGVIKRQKILIDRCRKWGLDGPFTRPASLGREITSGLRKMDTVYWKMRSLIVAPLLYVES